MRRVSCVWTNSQLQPPANRHRRGERILMTLTGSLAARYAFCHSKRTPSSDHPSSVMKTPAAAISVSRRTVAAWCRAAMAARYTPAIFFFSFVPRLRPTICSMPPALKRTVTGFRASAAAHDQTTEEKRVLPHRAISGARQEKASRAPHRSEGMDFIHQSSPL